MLSVTTESSPAATHGHNNGATATTTNDTLPDLLTAIIVALLSGCEKVSGCSALTYPIHMQRLLRYRCTDQSIVDYVDVPFIEWPLPAKVAFLHYLCDIRLQAPNIESTFSDLSADSLRIQPLGTDLNGSKYWYFNGTRLYREDCPQSTVRNRWQLLCETKTDWIALVEKLSSNAADRTLHEVLEELLPSVILLFNKKYATFLASCLLLHLFDLHFHRFARRSSRKRAPPNLWGFDKEQTRDDENTENQQGRNNRR